MRFIQLLIVFRHTCIDCKRRPDDPCCLISYKSDKAADMKCFPSEFLVILCMDGRQEHAIFQKFAYIFTEINREINLEPFLRTLGHIVHLHKITPGLC